MKKIYKLTDRKLIRYLCDKYNFHFAKQMGQNFLTNEDVLVEITKAADCKNVIEIGPGFGTLTSALAQTAEKVVAIELDDRLLPVLEETLSGFENIKIIQGDVLKVNLPELIKTEFGDEKVSVAANLPYYITTPIVMTLLEQKLPLESVVVMVQREVAERMVATPGGKEYGALSIACRFYSRPEIVTTVSAQDFVPMPKVDSAVVKLSIIERPDVQINDDKLFFRLVKASFAQRRKTLTNAILNSKAFDITKERLLEIYKEMGVVENIRGEALSIEQFACLSNYLGVK